MPGIDPKFKGWKPATWEEVAKLESEAQIKLDMIKNIIVNKESCREKDTGVIVPCGYLLKRLVLLGMFFAEHTGVNDYFYSDSKCTGCGTCEKVCTSGKIRMVDKRPVWQKDIKCHMCYACLNYCPKSSTQIKSKVYIKSYTEKNERYPHPYATVSDIAGQR